MRIRGSESNIKSGLAELYVAAAPVLQQLALHDITFTPQCLIYLIEGLQTSVIHDPQSQPAQPILQAVRTIWSKMNPRYVKSVVKTITSYNSDYYNTLKKYAPEWEMNQSSGYALIMMIQSWNYCHKIFISLILIQME